MKLIKINKNVFANPNYIQCVEQKLRGDRLSVTVYVGEEEYDLDMGENPEKAIKEFFEELDKVPDSVQQQYFAG